MKPGHHENSVFTNSSYFVPWLQCMYKQGAETLEQHTHTLRNAKRRIKRRNKDSLGQNTGQAYETQPDPAN